VELLEESVGNYLYQQLTVCRLLGGRYVLMKRKTKTYRPFYNGSLLELYITRRNSFLPLKKSCEADHIIAADEYN
jgi:hypothetical protein